MAISMLKIRRPLGRLIFNMGIAIPGKTVFLIETAPLLPGSPMKTTLINLQHFLLIAFLAATKQLYKWYFPSVCLSVCPSVRLSVTPFSPCSHHRIIMKFSGVITMVNSDVHAKGQGQRSKVKVTEVNTQLRRFRTLTPV